MPNCYYYDEQRNRCNCYVNENLNELLAENAKLRELCEDMLDYIEIREAFGRPPTSEMFEEFAQRADKLGLEVE